MVLAAGTEIFISVLRHSAFHLPKQDIAFALLYGLVGFLIGAKLFFLVTTIPFMMQHPDVFFASFETINATLIMGGYSFLGGLSGAGLGTYLYCHQFKIRWWAFVNTALPGVPLSLAVARVGCFVAGCCHGIPSHFGLFMNHAPLAPHDIRLFPTQLLEIAGNMIVFLVLLQQKKREDGRMLFIYLIGYSLLRICLEPFRADAALYTYFYLSVATWFCLITLLFSMICLIRLDKQKSA